MMLDSGLYKLYADPLNSLKLDITHHSNMDSSTTKVIEFYDVERIEAYTGNNKPSKVVLKMLDGDHVILQ